MLLKEEIRVVVGAGGYNNNPEWIQTEETELNLLKRGNWEKSFHLIR